MEYPQKSNSYFLRLDEYILMAKKCIVRFVPNRANQLLINDDFIADIAHDIMMADWRWDGRGNRIGYRSKCAKWSIFEKLKKKKKDIKTLSLDEELGYWNGTNYYQTKRIKDILEDKTLRNNEVTEDLLRNFSLTDTQTEYLLRNINGEHPKDIAKDKGVTNQNVSLTLKLAKEKIRRFYDKRFSL